MADEEIKAPVVLTMEGLAEKLDFLLAENVKLKSLIAETKISTDAPEKLKTPTEPVEILGKKYIWQVPHFRWAELGIVTAEEANCDEEILEAIVAVKGQELLKVQE